MKMIDCLYANFMNESYYKIFNFKENFNSVIIIKSILFTI